MMSIFNFFKNENKDEVQKYNKLYSSLQVEFPNLAEKELVITSCIAGLLARVAYVDFHLATEEVEKMDDILNKWGFCFDVQASDVAQMAIKHIKEMAGLENHLYVHPLKNHLSVDDRYRVLQSLFLIAASDGNVDGIESEEIRLITKGLELSNQHFLAARAEVAKYLTALK
jgi:uncharacterized tellurite resistance protein B-like protein